MSYNATNYQYENIIIKELKDVRKIPTTFVPLLPVADSVLKDLNVITFA